MLDHLVAWNAGSTNQEWYAYDASGNRVLRRSTTGSGTSITTYAFGLEEHLYGATGINTGNTYYYNLGGRLIGALTGITTLTPQFFLTDALGSVLATFSATAGSAAVLGNQVYGPYGNQRYTQGSMGTAKGYTGQYADATGLDYYNARYYDPIVGRFVSADTVQGNEQGMDPYAYVMGNPETSIDPTGHWAWWQTIAAAVVIVAVVAAPILVGGGVMLAASFAADATAATILSAGATAATVTASAGAVTTGVAALSATAQIIADRQAGKWTAPQDIGPDIWSNVVGEAAGNFLVSNLAFSGISQYQQATQANHDAQQQATVHAQATTIAKSQGHANTPATRRTPTPKSRPISRPTYTHQSTSSYSSWTYGYSYTGTLYGYSSTVYHYANPAYNYQVVSNTLDGYYQRISGGMRMS